MLTNGAGFVPEIELIAYQRGRTWLDTGLLLVQHVRFYAAGHRWPLVLGEGEIAAALHLTGEPLPVDVDELAVLTFRGVLGAGLDEVDALDRATTALTERFTCGLATAEDKTRFTRRWGDDSLAHHTRCLTAAARLSEHAPDQPRTLPPADGLAPREVA